MHTWTLKFHVTLIHVLARLNRMCWWNFWSKCTFSCHCLSDKPCDYINGSCPDNLCALGWKSNNCSINSFYNLWSIIYYKKIVSMIRKYHNRKLQTNPWHREEEPHNNHESPGSHILLAMNELIYTRTDAVSGMLKLIYLYNLNDLKYNVRALRCTDQLMPQKCRQTHHTFRRKTEC